MKNKQFHSFRKVPKFNRKIVEWGKINTLNHWGKADDHNCNYGHPKMADVESGKNLFCRLNCFYYVF